MDLMRMSERDYWAEVAKRPAMFLGRTTLTGLEGYLFGYDAHAHRHGGLGLDGWTDWLVARMGRECNHGWNGKVRHLALGDKWESWELPADQEQQVIKVLFDLLDEFLAEREMKGTRTR
ncbi:hypothetical protein ACIBL3_06640 [Kribbella sp. NPDC050124]|uniref:hypothetical protein n=1 Tax=Kribbella sp. NPDC050124 TaxID=3364114 RepID=UPI0037984D39